MQRPSVRVNVTVKPDLTVRRPPRQLIDLLDQPEDEFRQYVNSVEGSSAFQELLRSGAVRRVRARGRVPREKYEEYMDVQLMQFLRQYRITRFSDWERDFRDRGALERVPQLAAKYGAPADRLRRVLEYFQRITFEEEAAERYGYGPELDAQEPDYVELIPSRADVDLTDNIILMREFVETYGLSEQDFTRDFLQGEEPAAALAERYEAPLDEVNEILEALGRLHIVETFIAGGAHRERPTRTASLPHERVEPVARVLSTDNGRAVAIQFTDDGMYAQRYRTSPDALQRISEAGFDEARLEKMLLELQWINQRKTLLCRLVMASCNYQYRFFLTGEVYAMKPLSQADMARQLGEDEATVCRLLRDKFIDTPFGPMELRFLFQKKTDVVRRIVERNPDLTDNQIRELLEHDYGTQISRRTVAYHRLKFQRRDGAAEAAD